MSRNADQDRERVALPATRVALWLAFGAFVTLLSLQDIHSHDYWWHLRTGALIAETGQVPRVDPYTFTVPGARWIDIHWLFQLGLHGLYGLGGHAAVVLAQVALVWVLVALLAPIGYRRERPWITLAGLATCLVLASDRIAPRPELPTFVLLAAVLALLDRFERRGDAWVYAIVPVQLLWANVHGLFALGIAVCGAHLVAELARPLGKRGERPRWKRVRRLGTATALAALAAFANPNGSEGALYPLMQLGMIGPAATRNPLGARISELQPALVALKPGPLACFLALAAASLAALALNWRRTPFSDVLLWFAFLYLALAARRNTAVFGVLAAPMLARNLNDFLDGRAVLRTRRAQLAAAGAFALLFAAGSLDIAHGSFFGRLGRYQTTGVGVIQDLNPVGAFEWIARVHPPGPIAHEMHDGGYLLWRLYPEYRDMSDGRLEVFGADNLLGLWVFSPERFTALDAKYHFGSALVHYNRSDRDALLGWLYRSPEWCLGFVDDVAAVFVRRPGANAPCPVPEVDVGAPDLFPPVGAGATRLELGRYLARSRFFAAVGRPDRAVAVWREALVRFPDYPLGQELLGGLELELRRQAQQRAE